MGNVNAKEDRSGTLRVLRHGSLDSSSAQRDQSSSSRLSTPVGRRLRAYTTPSSSSAGADASGPSGGRKSKSKSKDKKKRHEPQYPPPVDPNDMVDGGYLAPHGVYSGPITYSYDAVRKLVLERRIAPFYKGLSDYEEEWTDRQVIAMIRGIKLEPEAPEVPEAVPDPQETVPQPVQDPVQDPVQEPVQESVQQPVQPVQESVQAPAQEPVQAPAQEPVPQSVPPVQVAQTKPDLDVDYDGGDSSVSLSSPVCMMGMVTNDGQSADTPVTPMSSEEFPDVKKDVPELCEPSDPVGESSQSSQKGTQDSTTVDQVDQVEDTDSTDDLELRRIHQLKEEFQHLEYQSPHSPSTASSMSENPAFQQQHQPQQQRQQQQQQPQQQELDVPFRRPRSRTAGQVPSSSPADSSGSPRAPPEVQLYRGAIECPICFLYYPKYLNNTRCCAQPICTECFVQIKRPDPHPPYNNSEDGPAGNSELAQQQQQQQIQQQQQSSSSAAAGDSHEHTLVSEPACCPYCMAPEFGVVYIPPPFRSGHSIPRSIASVFARSNPDSRNASTASLESKGSSAGQHNRPGVHRGSIPPSAPEVVTTDHVRPDWATKLEAARAHLARRSAAANALHATAFMVQTPTSSSHSGNGRKKKRFPGFSGSSNSSSSALNQQSAQSSPASPGSAAKRADPDAGTNRVRRRESRAKKLEEKMLADAIQRSLQESEAHQASANSSNTNDPDKSRTVDSVSQTSISITD